MLENSRAAMALSTSTEHRVVAYQISIIRRWAEISRETISKYSLSHNYNNHNIAMARLLRMHFQDEALHSHLPMLMLTVK